MSGLIKKMYQKSLINNISDDFNLNNKLYIDDISTNLPISTTRNLEFIQ